MEGRSTSVVLLGAILLSFLVLSLPTAAAHPDTGPQLTLVGPGCYLATDTPTSPATGSFSANTAFFIQHGWIAPGWSTLPGADRGAIMRPTTTFKLSIDGALQTAEKNFIYDETTDTLLKRFRTHFPAGMPAGTYLFRGEFYLDGFLVGGVPGTSLLQIVCQKSVTFT